MNCLYCNKPVEGRRNTKKYCSKTCKQYAYLNRSFGINSSPATIDDSKLVLTSPEEIKNHSEKAEEEQKPNLQNNFPQKTIGPSHLYRTKKEEEKTYCNVWPDIFRRIQDMQIASDINGNYFQTSGYGARVTPSNFSAFSFIMPRLYCMIENLFRISYKRKVYHNTIQCLHLAMVETILTEQMKQMPIDFPYLDDLFQLFDQLDNLSKALEEDKDGIKFSLAKNSIAKYLIFLGLIRENIQKKSFAELFPEIYKSGGNLKKNAP